EYTAASSAATCKLCSQPLRDIYYQVNQQAFCPSCRERLQQALDSGSALGRFGRATLYGSLAGLVGAAIYYGVRELTNINFGLISILVGLMIGKAVQKGCNARGGWFYQALAMFLTYTAIVLTYIPPMIQMMRQGPAPAAAAQAQPGQPIGAPKQEEAAVPAGGGGPANGGPLYYVIMAVVWMCVAFAIPILVGFQSPMSLVIIGIGLYEAWVINKRRPLVISGPYRIGPSAEGSVIDAEPVG
ncbi:MAG: hypothetical protein ACREHD_02190, partial [Pirellulales bacterium]